MRATLRSVIEACILSHRRFAERLPSAEHERKLDAMAGGVPCRFIRRQQGSATLNMPGPSSGDVGMDGASRKWDHPTTGWPVGARPASGDTTAQALLDIGTAGACRPQKYGQGRRRQGPLT